MRIERLYCHVRKQQFLAISYVDANKCWTSLNTGARVVPSPVTTLREGDVFVELSLGKFPIRNYPGSLGATVLGTTGRSIHKR